MFRYQFRKKLNRITSALPELGHVEVITGSTREGIPILNEGFLDDVIRVEVDFFTRSKINRHYISISVISLIRVLKLTVNCTNFTKHEKNRSVRDEK